MRRHEQTSANAATPTMRVPDLSRDCLFFGFPSLSIMGFNKLLQFENDLLLWSFCSHFRVYWPQYPCWVPAREPY